MGEVVGQKSRVLEGRAVYGGRSRLWGTLWGKEPFIEGKIRLLKERVVFGGRSTSIGRGGGRNWHDIISVKVFD